MSLQPYNLEPCLTPARLVATSNQSGSYLNGPLNNGVGATFTYATGVLTVDSVDVELGDRVILSAQTAANQNGVYVCSTLGAVGISAVLTRASDFQSIEQIREGFWITVGAGTVSAGSALCVVEPLPGQLGVDDLTMISMLSAGAGTAATKAASNNALPTVASVSGATTANGMAVFADTAGTVKDPTAGVTLAQDFTISSGNLTVSTGNVNMGAGFVFRSAANALTAHAGGGQGSATPLTRQINRVTTVASAGDSVVLPAATAGKVITVCNSAATNAMDCFPATGEHIDALAPNAALSIVADNTVLFFSAVAGIWNALVSA